MNTKVAITHNVSPGLDEGLSSDPLRAHVDVAKATQQQAGYEEMLRGLGYEVRQLDVNRDEPDGVFIEDAAVILDEAAILTSMGAPSRRNEPERIAPVLGEYRTIVRMPAGATIEGGDVLRVGKTLFAGRSARTNAAGVQGLRAAAGYFGYRVIDVPVRGCLHFKTACSAMPDGRLLARARWLDVTVFEDAGFTWMEPPHEDAWGAHTMLAGGVVCLAAAHLATAQWLTGMGIEIRTVELSEFAKVDGGITCLSLLIEN